MMRVETMQPQKAPKNPTSGSQKKPCPTMNTITSNPMPKAVPKLVSEINWNFLKYELKRLSEASEMIAGLSLRKVITAPSEATPGRLKRGFISGRTIRSRRLTTPNSTNMRPIAPVRTQMAMR